MPLAFKISCMICGDSSSEDSGKGFEIDSNSMFVLFIGREAGLVY